MELLIFAPHSAMTSDIQGRSKVAVVELAVSVHKCRDQILIGVGFSNGQQVA